MLGREREADLAREAERFRRAAGVAHRRPRLRRFATTSSAALVRAFRTLVVGAVATLLGAAATSATASAAPEPLERAAAIRAEVDARYRLVPGRGLRVTEAATTSVIESFTLLTPDLLETRVVPADNGLYFALCPLRATCPYPARRRSRPAADAFPRRVALELALRTFVETSASVVAVSLPTPRFVIFVVERDELAREVNVPALAEALRGEFAGSAAAWLQHTVDRVTRGRIFVPLGLEPTASGRDTLWAIPRWPTADITLSRDQPAAATGNASATPVRARSSGTNPDARNSVTPRTPAAADTSGYDAPARLNEVAHAYSLGVGEVRCPTHAEWNAYYGSAFGWGATNLRADYATLAPFICAGALAVGTSVVPLWQQAAGVWVLVHEAFHLRHWRFRRNEAQVACQAIVYFREAAMRLGASEVQAEELYPYALALHIRQARLFSWYRDRKCQAPLWVPPVP
jgi:hypothetical protein